MAKKLKGYIHLSKKNLSQFLWNLIQADLMLFGKFADVVSYRWKITIFNAKDEMHAEEATHINYTLNWGTKMRMGVP